MTATPEETEKDWNFEFPKYPEPNLPQFDELELPTFPVLEWPTWDFVLPTSDLELPTWDFEDWVFENNKNLQNLIL